MYISVLLYDVSVVVFHYVHSFLLVLYISIYITMVYDFSPILLAVEEEYRICKFPTTHTVHSCTGYVFVCVCRCVRTNVHVTKPPLTQSMTPFFLIYVLYSVLMYLYSLNSYIHHVYACVYMHTNMFVRTYLCGNLQYISQYPTHSMYVVFYNVIYTQPYVHQYNVTLGHTKNNFL